MIDDDDSILYVDGDMSGESGASTFDSCEDKLRFVELLDQHHIDVGSYDAHLAWLEYATGDHSTRFDRVEALLMFPGGAP